MIKANPIKTAEQPVPQISPIRLIDPRLRWARTHHSSWITYVSPSWRCSLGNGITGLLRTTVTNEWQLSWICQDVTLISCNYATAKDAIASAPALLSSWLSAMQISLDAHAARIGEFPFTDLDELASD